MTAAVTAFSRSALGGLLAGLCAALIWGLYIGYSRLGIVGGLSPTDFIVLRFLPAALLAFPLIARHGLVNLAGIGWGKSIILAIFAGPLFIWFSTAGYLYAPLPHGAVLPPAGTALGGLAIAWAVFGDRIPRERLWGAVLLVAGLICVAGAGLMHEGSRTWLGDRMFAAAGIMWAIYTMLLRRWRLDGLSSTAAVVAVSALVAIPAGLYEGSFARLAALPAGSLMMQVLMQGFLAGFLAVVFYGWSVTALGSDRASFFPSIVPALGMLFGIPLTGDWPSPLQWVGMALVSGGLALGVGVHRILMRSRLARP